MKRDLLSVFLQLESPGVSLGCELQTCGVTDIVYTIVSSFLEYVFRPVEAYRLILNSVWCEGGGVTLLHLFATDRRRWNRAVFSKAI